MKKSYKKISFVFLILITLLMIADNLAYPYEYLTVTPTTEDLEEYRTEHFNIIYQKDLKFAVDYLATQCEEAYKVLTSIFGWSPKEKIDVLFIDSFDTHNGWASSIPHNRMSIYAAGAEPGSMIFQPGNYLRRTVYHELAHVLSLDMHYGYNSVLSKIFGKMLPVNDDPLSGLLFYFSASPVMLAPEWYLEGIAVWAETEFTPPGRGRMSIPDMIFRCAVNEGNLLPYNRWDLEIPYWPYGNGAYLYGMKVIKYIDDQNSETEVAGDLAQSLAHSFMFNFDKHSTKVMNERIKIIVHKMLQNEQKTQRENIEELKKVPLTQVPRLTDRQIMVYSPVFVNDRVYFIAHEEEARDTLYVYIPEERRTQKITHVRVTAPFASLSVSSDNRYIYYTRLEIQQKDNYWYEVRRFDTITQKDILVTDSGRYRAIDVSPDGRNIIAVSMREGISYLLEIPLADAREAGQEKVLAEGVFQESFSTPKCSPDGEHIVYVRAKNDDFDFNEEDVDGFDLVVFDRKTGKSKSVYHSEHQIVFPRWHVNNKSIIFSSDENGVFNLYEISLDNPDEPVPLTHVLGGLFAYDLSPDGKTIAAVAYDSRGYYLTMLPYDPESPARNGLPRIKAEWKEKVQDAENGDVSSSMKEPGFHPYSSFRNTRFDYWGPWLTASAEEIMGGVGMVFSDPAGYQNLKILAGKESEYNSDLASIHYQYRGFYPTFHLFAGQYQENYPDLVLSEDDTRYDYAEDIRTVGTAVDIPLIKRDRQISLQLGYKLIDRDFIEESGEEYRDTNIKTKDLNDQSEGSLWAKLDFFNGTAFGRSNSVEDGRYVAFTVERTDDRLGGDLCQTRMMSEWSEYISNPWVKNHVLKLSFIYGYGEGDHTAQRMFGLGGFGFPILSSSFGIERSIPLRGYYENFQTGDRIVKAGLSYRFPIYNLSRGATGSMPIYFNQIFAEVFYEGGRTWDEKEYDYDMDDEYWMNAAGFEVNFSIKLLRYLRIAPGLGFVYAPQRIREDSEENDDDTDERFQAYISIKGFVNF